MSWALRISLAAVDEQAFIDVSRFETKDEAIAYIVELRMSHSHMTHWKYTPVEVDENGRKVSDVGV